MAEKKNNHKTLKKVLFVVAGLFIVALIFNAAMFFIGMKTNHFQRWAGEQYFGEIIEMNDSGFVIDGKNNKERKTVVLDEKTVVKKGAKDARNDLKAGERVMVLGPKNKDEKIEAKLVRIFDPNDPESKPSRNPPPF